MSQPLAELTDIHLVRGDTHVFNGLSLRLDYGENTAILGPNGAGKTSLLKMLASDIHPLVRPGSRVRLMGLDRWNVWELRHHLGMLSQDLQERYEPEATGLQVVLSGLYSSIGTFAHQTFGDADIERARQLLQQHGIADLATVRFGRMSTGQQRRCLLARALIHDPDALILDEPTAGLDLAAATHYLQRVRTLAQSGKTLVLVTHHLQEIPPEVTRCVLLKAGKVMADGPKQEVLTSETLSRLYDVPLQLIEADGWYHAVPAENRGSE